jgi:beta-galactosidase
MLVIDEAFDCWRHGKNPGDYSLWFEEWWGRDLSWTWCGATSTIPAW